MKFVLINMHREKFAVHFMLFITFHSPKVNFIRQIYLTNFIASNSLRELLACTMNLIKMLDKLALFVILYLSVGNKEDGIT